MTSLEYLDIAAEITYLQRDLVEKVRRGDKLEYCDVFERLRILSTQFAECIQCAGAAHQVIELQTIYWQLAGDRINGDDSAG
jgi:hypothetical protein